MDQKTERSLQRLTGKKVGVFVDDSNLYHASRKSGWRVDFSKLYTLLQHYCQLKFIHYHLAIPHKSDDVAHGTSRFMRKLEPYVTFVKKELKYTPVAGKFVKKADVDVEITLDVVRTINQLDAAIIVSGDSDYMALREYVLKDKGKQIFFIAFEKSMAWELKYGWRIFLDSLREEILLPIEVA